MHNAPYHFACPIHAVLPGGSEALIASCFVARANDGALNLVLPAHFASARGELEDLNSWLSEVWVRPSPDKPAVRLSLFEDEAHARPLFNGALGSLGAVDVIAVPIPEAVVEHFAAANIIDAGRARAPALGEKVFFFGFPHIFARWPGPCAWPLTATVDGEFTCTVAGSRGVCGGYSGSAMIGQASGNNDLVGMIAAGEGGNALFIPGDIIAAIVNGAPVPRVVPLHVAGRSLAMGVG
jgi:hypothetical protein